jgi:cell division protein FtsI (penicillin-binding protein 3)
MRNGATVQQFRPEVIRESICSEKTLRTIQEILLEVVENGTGRPARSDVVRIAGKTGTAQVSEGGSYRGNGHQVSFAGYFPAEKPIYSCIAVILRPRHGYPSAGAMSGAVVKQIAEEIYASQTRWDIRKEPVHDETVAVPAPKAGEMQALKHVLNKFDITMDRDQVKSQWVTTSVNGNEVKLSDIPIREGLVPRVLGMGAKDAVYLMESAGLQVRLSGKGRVVAQSIPPGERAVKGKTVTITLN